MRSRLAASLSPAFGPAHRVGREGVHRQRLLGRQHDLHQLAAQQRVVADGRPKARRLCATTIASLTQRRIIAAARTPCDSRDRLTCSIICLKPLGDVAHEIGGGAVQDDLARGHGARAELVLQPHDPVAVAAAVLEPPRQGEQAEALRAGRRAARPGQQDRDIGVGMAAEPFLAMELPALDAVGADTDALGLGLERADVGAAGLLGHELRALQHGGRVLAQQPVEQQLLQRRGAVALDDEVGGVGHRHRAHQAELGLHEEIGDAVFHQRMGGLRHAQHAGAMAHGVHAEVLEGDLLHLAIGGMVVDPVLVAAEAVARMQHRRVLVGHHGEIVEAVAGERAQPLEMRRHRRAQAGLQVERQQVLELPVDGIEVPAVRIGRDVLGAVRRLGHVGRHVGHGFLLTVAIRA